MTAGFNIKLDAFLEAESIAQSRAERTLRDTHWNREVAPARVVPMLMLLSADPTLSEIETANPEKSK